MATSYATSHQYQLSDDTTVYLTVIFGQGAGGSTLVLLDGQHLCAGTRIAKFRVGTRQAIQGKNLLITTATVATQNLSSNKVDLSGGGSTSQSWTDGPHGCSPGDNIVYICSVLFT